MRPLAKKNKILVVIFIGILLVLSLNFFQKEAKGFFYTFSSPIQTTFWALGDRVSDFFETIGNLSNLKTANDKSQKIIQELLAEKASFAELKKENETLREALQVGLQKDFQLAFVEIIGKDIGQESILINQGAGDGLSKGMPVMTQQKVLLGKIIEVYEDFSRVSLISNKESSFDATVLDRDASGVVKGKDSRLLDFSLVAQDKEIKEGDLVVSASLGGVYPKGLLVGSIQEVKQSDPDPFYQITVSPFFDLKKTNSVLIILEF